MIIGSLVAPHSHIRRIAANTAPSAPASPMNVIFDLDLNPDLYDSLSDVEDAHPGGSITEQESSSPKSSTSPTLKRTSGSQPVSQLAGSAQNLKGKGVKREAEPGGEGSARVPKRSRPLPPPPKSRPQPQTSKTPALAAGLTPKLRFGTIPPLPQPQPKPRPPAKRELRWKQPTGVSSTPSPTNPQTSLAAGGGSLSDSDSDWWDEV